MIFTYPRHLSGGTGFQIKKWVSHRESKLQSIVGPQSEMLACVLFWGSKYLMHHYQPISNYNSFKKVFQNSYT